ncbi:MAG TPA: hypothetical protein VK609_16790 [Mucilaginibacter sp.]|nr:hypothetical protein [Mucilaginibacter sp.]
MTYRASPTWSNPIPAVERNPYLIAKWATGAVKLVNRKSVTAKLKYDLIKDELLFQNKRDSAALRFVYPVQYFSFNDVAIDESNIAPLVFGRGYPPVDNQTQASFYQVIADGKGKLLKHYKKTIRVDQAFNS